MLGAVGKLVINTGGMFSGKSTELQKQGDRYIRAGKRVIFVKPTFDDRYSESEIVTHTGLTVPAVNSDSKLNIKAELLKYDVILIDELQFFEQSIVADLVELVMQGKAVYCSGLDMDFKGEPFAVVADVMARAHEVHKYHAVCVLCGEDADITGKLIEATDKTVELGASDKYVPMCRLCHSALKGLKFIH